MTEIENSSRESHLIREFEDESGDTWVAGIRARPGGDFKGRFVFVARPKSGNVADYLWLEDVRWNSESTARRTLESMSSVELRRRLRSALGRSVRRD
jgi:hypothetical protein